MCRVSALLRVRDALPQLAYNYLQCQGTLADERPSSHLEPSVYLQPGLTTSKYRNCMHMHHTCLQCCKPAAVQTCIFAQIHLAAYTLLSAAWTFMHMPGETQGSLQHHEGGLPTYQIFGLDSTCTAWKRPRHFLITAKHLLQPSNVADGVDKHKCLSMSHKVPGLQSTT